MTFRTNRDGDRHRLRGEALTQSVGELA